MSGRVWSTMSRMALTLFRAAVNEPVSLIGRTSRNASVRRFRPPGVAEEILRLGQQIFLLRRARHQAAPGVLYLSGSTKHVWRCG